MRSQKAFLFLIRSLACLLAMATLAFNPARAQAPAAKVGVLLVNHGSRSATWRAALLQTERNTREAMLRTNLIQGVKTAFMEYTEPSIATRMKEFDAEGFSDVVIVPVFLTVSSHTFDDIPTILGRKADPHSMQTLKIENIERYTPKARTHLAPNLDFSALLRENILRRAKALSKDPAKEGLVLIAYGDATYHKQWSDLMERTAAHVLSRTGMSTFSYGWAGHVAHYDPDHTTRAVEQVLRTRERAVVVPVLVAHDEMFQVKIIGGGIAQVPDHQKRVAYVPDAILPDPSVEAWVVATAREYAERARGGKAPGR
ncbi:MAG: cobalamin biosynthesis protein CbiX [Acidobacteria bacterium]|nr:cobalamin biosynthesis protein CbiX [Acidobacteriota bacterium]MBI3487151.1 cobalamin biosynthesis protein CbiX [Acidobacteriota bacterium]